MKEKHIVQIDGLRFFAVAAVMIAHWLQWQWGNSFFKAIPFVHGVILFFVLSGYLISKILLANRDIYNQSGLNKFILIKNFYIRRFFRIFPVYYLLITILFIVDYQNTRAIAGWLYSYTTNIYQAINNVYIGDFNHFWSLAVEEQFYLFFPFILLFIKPKRILSILIFIIFSSLLARFYFYFYVGKWMATSYLTLCCMYALGLGSLLAYFKMYCSKIMQNIVKTKWLYLSLALYVVLLYVQNILHWQWYKEILDEFFFAVLAFFIIAKASNNDFKGMVKVILENRLVVYLGKISYGLYIYHLFIPTIFSKMIEEYTFPTDNKYFIALFFFVVTFLISHLSWKFIEAPINKLKDKVPYLNEKK